MHETYNVCHSCAIVLTNGDDSHVHPHLLANVIASVEHMGPVSPVEVSEDYLMFMCDCCGGRKHGKIHRYENSF